MLSLPMKQAVRILVDKLEDQSEPWLIGGSTGLILQGVDIQTAPRDLDVYCDLSMTDTIYTCFKDKAIGPPVFSRTERYRSRLLHLELSGVVVEWVGAFEVANEGSLYKVRIAEDLLSIAPTIVMDDRSVRLMPLAHEYIFNWLREREDRYMAIAAQMRRNLCAHQQALQRIMAANQLSQEHCKKLMEILNKLG